MVSEEQAAAYGFSQAVRAGELLFCAGQVGEEADGTVPSDPARQFRLAFEALRQVLARHGLEAADIVDLTSFHVGYPAHMEEFAAEKTRFLGDARPAWTAIGVAALGYPQTLVEVKAIARISD